MQMRVLVGPTVKHNRKGIIMVKAVEIEVDGSRNENLIFAPLQRSIRGRFDFLRVPEASGKVKASDWPGVIPSQRLGIDPDGCGYITEPLHDESHKAIKEKIEKAGMKLEPDLATFEGIDLPTWFFWIKQAVESGLAKVVKGKLLDHIDGKPKLDFIFNEPAETPVDKLTVVIERQTAMFAKLLERLGNV